LAWTWFVSGGVARGEAIPGSDVEILIVLDDDVDEAGKTEMLAWPPTCTRCWSVAD
jgi:CBS domain-containing protein